MTRLTHRALAHRNFVTLQRTVFQVYFWGQTLLLVLVALTIPPHGVYSLMESKLSMGIFALAEGAALLNLVVYGPRTKDLMDEILDHSM